MSRKRNLAARAGHWSANHRKTAIWGWLAFVIALVVIGGAVGTRAAEQDEGGPGESGRADKAINEAFDKSSDESVLVQSGRYNVRRPGVPRRGAGRDGRRLGPAARARRRVALPVRGHLR